MDAKVSQLLNEQINKEFYSAYLYLDMANYYDTKGLDGFANWFEIQAKEEQDHAMLMYQYLHNNDQTVTLEAIAKPDKVYGELIDPLKAAYEHEQFVTASIHTIYAAAKAADDFRAMQFLDWFVKEPRHAVSRLVRQGAGRGGEERLRSHHEDGALRLRRERALHAQSGARRARLQRPVAGALIGKR